MPLPRDAHYVPGSARKLVRTSDGRTVTRQQAMNEFARTVGAENDYALRRAARKAGSITSSPTYQRDLARARTQGYTPTEFKAMAQMLSAEPRNTRGQIADKSPGGPLDTYLKATGRKPDDAQWSVGETPSVFA